MLRPETAWQDKQCGALLGGEIRLQGWKLLFGRQTYQSANPTPIFLFWGWDWDHQSYSGEGSGFLGNVLYNGNICERTYPRWMLWVGSASMLSTMKYIYRVLLVAVSVWKCLKFQAKTNIRKGAECVPFHAWSWTWAWIQVEGFKHSSRWTVLTRH